MAGRQGKVQREASVLQRPSWGDPGRDTTQGISLAAMKIYAYGKGMLTWKHAGILIYNGK